MVGMTWKVITVDPGHSRGLYSWLEVLSIPYRSWRIILVKSWNISALKLHHIIGIDSLGCRTMTKNWWNAKTKLYFAKDSKCQFNVSFQQIMNVNVFFFLFLLGLVKAVGFSFTFVYHRKESIYVFILVWSCDWRH